MKTKRQTGEEGRRGLLSDLIIFAFVYTLTECRGDDTEISLGKQNPLGSSGGTINEKRGNYVLTSDMQGRVTLA